MTEHPAFDRFLEERLCDPDVRAAYERAQARARLCDDVQDAVRSVRWPEHLSPEDCAMVADKLWEKGYRRDGVRNR